MNQHETDKLFENRQLLLCRRTRGHEPAQRLVVDVSGFGGVHELHEDPLDRGRVLDVRIVPGARDDRQVTTRDRLVRGVAMGDGDDRVAVTAWPLLSTTARSVLKNVRRCPGRLRDSNAAHDSSIAAARMPLPWKNRRAAGRVSAKPNPSVPST